MVLPTIECSLTCAVQLRSMLRLEGVNGNRQAHLRQSGMDPWRKETLGLQVGDFIIWQDEAIEVEGQPAVVTPGMKGKVISLHDGFHLDVVQGKPSRPRLLWSSRMG